MILLFHDFAPVLCDVISFLDLLRTGPVVVVFVVCDLIGHVRVGLYRVAISRASGCAGGGRGRGI